MPGIARPKERQLVDEVMGQHYAGVSLKQALDLYDSWDEFDKFVQADHWPNPTPGTETLPRPVTNFVWADVDFLVSSLLGEQPVPYFIPREGATADQAQSMMAGLTDRSADARLLSEVAQFTWDNLNMDVLSEDIADTGFTLGTGIAHYYWDPDKRGGTPDRGTLTVGDIGAAEIDPNDFFPGNPKSDRMQSQPWIIVTERRPLAQVRKKYRQYVGSVVDSLQPDAYQSYGETSKWRINEQQDAQYITLRHRWWKERDGDSDRLAYVVVANGRVIRYEEELYPFPLYPFAAFRPWRRRKSFWGMGIVEQEINNQKEANRLDAMTLLNAYRTGMPQRLYKPESGFNPQKHDNNPGANIPDNSPPGQWGIRFLEPPQMPPYIQQWKQFNRRDMQQVAGTLDAMTGRQLPGHQNASAIAYLQQTGFLRLQKVRTRFYRFLQESVTIWYAFWQHYYHTERLIRIAGPNNTVAFQWFRGTDYRDVEFDVRVKAGPGTILNRAAMMSEAKELVQAGWITPEMYVQMLPDEIMPYKEQVIEHLRQVQAQQQAAPPQAAPPQAALGGGGAPPQTQPMPM